MARKIVIIDSGIIDAAIAQALAVKGARDVTMIEAGTLAGQSPGRPFGWTNAIISAEAHLIALFTSPQWKPDVGIGNSLGCPVDELPRRNKQLARRWLKDGFTTLYCPITYSQKGHKRCPKVILSPIFGFITQK